MTKLIATLVGSLLVLAVAAGARAEEKTPAKKPAAAQTAGKEVTLKGTFGCEKCSFKEAKQCSNVLKVKESGKDVSYHFAKNPVSDDHHEEICHNAGKPATVTGTVSEKGGKKTITASDIKFD
jgi:hypothetical protein